MGKYEQLEQLQKLKETGSLSEQEYEKEKKKILDTVETNSNTNYKFVIISITIAIIIIGLIFLSLISNSGNKVVQLPNFVGLTLEQAEQKANELGLKLNIIEESSSKVEKGKIINQDPKYQESYTIKEGTTINLVVSSGKNK